MEGVETLRFFSWWFEAKTKKYVTVEYDLRSGKMTVFIDDLPGEHEIVNPKTKSGLDLECWDLYIGAELPIFGKTVVLKQCDMSTSQWIAYYSESLQTTKSRLLQELRKYEIKPLPMWVLQSGERNLRLLQKQCREVKERLERFRPKLAQEIVAGGLGVRREQMVD